MATPRIGSGHLEVALTQALVKGEVALFIRIGVGGCPAAGRAPLGGAGQTNGCVDVEDKGQVGLG